MPEYTMYAGKCRLPKATKLGVYRSTSMYI